MINIGFIGLRRMAANHLQRLQQIPEARVVAGAVLDPDRREETGLKFSLRGFADYKVMLDRRNSTRSMFVSLHLPTKARKRRLLSGAWRTLWKSRFAWTWSMPGSRQAAFVLQIEQKYQQIQCTLSQGDHPSTLTDAKLTGDRITFRVEQDEGGRKITKEFAGTIRGNSITGTITSAEGQRVQNSRWKAVRDPSTLLPIESGYTHSDLLWH